MEGESNLQLSAFCFRGPFKKTITRILYLNWIILILHFSVPTLTENCVNDDLQKNIKNKTTHLSKRISNFLTYRSSKVYKIFFWNHFMWRNKIYLERLWKEIATTSLNTCETNLWLFWDYFYEIAICNRESFIFKLT